MTKLQLGVFALHHRDSRVQNFVVSHPGGIDSPALLVRHLNRLTGPELRRLAVRFALLPDVQSDEASVTDIAEVGNEDSKLDNSEQGEPMIHKTLPDAKRARMDERGFLTLEPSLEETTEGEKEKFEKCSADQGAIGVKSVRRLNREDGYLHIDKDMIIKVNYSISQFYLFSQIRI
ncbi:unnamed protein product [Protopolystoma xenopodis]|uniref:Uncharacterized protein n=1 Tax=Protopolystoma xenopodis TaxID=117903 RepID=A0A448WSZ1_9PLAT|nr:unnamed protein product [Protopolystoma xenopodis]